MERFRKVMNKQLVLTEGLKKLDISYSETQLSKILEFFEYLTFKNTQVNLMSKRDLERWDEFAKRHVLDSLSVIPAIRKSIGMEDISMLDVGSGAGFPGLPIKLFFPNLTTYFLEATKKKVDFINEACKEFDLRNSATIWGRAEILGHDSSHRGMHDVVISRAVAPLRTLLELTLPFCRLGGIVIAMKGKKAIYECAESSDALLKLGGDIETVTKVSQLLPDSEGELVVIKKTKETPDEYPRRPGLPQKNPY